MSLLDQAILDTQAISEGVFSSSVSFTAVSGETCTVQALANKIGRKISDEGVLVNSKNATVVVHENTLTNAGFPVRNSQNEVAMNGTLVSVNDSSGVSKNYIVLETISDESVGLITLMLGDYVPN